MTSRVRVYLGCSVDGCIAGPNHDLSFLTEHSPEPAGGSDEGLGFEEFMGQIGAMLMGRRTYQVVLDHEVWHYGQCPVLVATHRDLPPPPGEGIARAVCGPITDLIAEAKAAAGGKDVYLDGGDLVRQGLEAGVVDEICLTFLPLVLGPGIRLWEGLSRRTDLEFAPPVSFGTGMVQLTARVLR